MSSLDYLDLCRLCLVKDQVSVPIFDGEGDVRQIFLKIAACLPVKLTRDDKLPKKICNDCVYKVELFYEFWNTTSNSEKQLMQWLGEVDVNDKQTYVTAVINQDQSSDNRLDGNVMQQTNEHQNNMGMNIIETMSLEMPMMMSTDQTQMTINTTNNSNSQSIQALPGTSAQQKDGMGESEEDNSDDDMDRDEGLPVKEEIIQDTNRIIEPGAFLNVSLPCDEPGPSGLQQQKNADIPDMVIGGQTTESDNKAGNEEEKNHSGPFESLLYDDEEKIIVSEQEIKLENEEDCIETHQIINCESSEIKSELYEKAISVGVDAFDCPICGSIFLSKSSLENHEIKVHSTESDNDIQDELINEQINKNNINITSDKKFNFSCNICNKLYKRKYSLKRHFEQKHKSLWLKKTSSSLEIKNKIKTKLKVKESVKIAVLSVDNKYHCQLCEKKYNSKSCLYEHMRSHSTSYLKCDKCQYKTTFKAQLIQHRAAVHNLGYDFKCQFCSKQYTMLKELRKHLRNNHANLLPSYEVFFCHKCPKKYGSYKTLMKHLDNHPLDITYQCHDCGFTTKQKHILTEHIRLHHRSAYDYHCDICKKAYKVYSSYKYHMTAKHPNKTYQKVYTCHICNREYFLKNSLSKHMKVHS